MTGTMRRILPGRCVGCMLVLGCFSLARADSPTLKDVRTAIGENLVAYPQLEGLADEIAQQAVNDDIILRGDIAKHLVSLSALGGNGLSLVVDYQAFLHSDVLSITFSAKGQMPNGREGQAFTALTYDLQTGKPIKGRSCSRSWRMLPQRWRNPGDDTDGGTVRLSYNSEFMPLLLIILHWTRMESPLLSLLHAFPGQRLCGAGSFTMRSWRTG